MRLVSSTHPITLPDTLCSVMADVTSRRRSWFLSCLNRRSSPVLGRRHCFDGRLGCCQAVKPVLCLSPSIIAADADSPLAPFPSQLVLFPYYVPSLYDLPLIHTYNMNARFLYRTRPVRDRLRRGRRSTRGRVERKTRWSIHTHGSSVVGDVMNQRIQCEGIDDVRREGMLQDVADTDQLE